MMLQKQLEKKQEISCERQFFQQRKHFFGGHVNLVLHKLT